MNSLLIQLYERRKIDNNSGLKELKLLQAKDKIWLNVDNLFMRQNVEQTIRYIQEDQEYLNSEIKQIKQRILSQTKKLKLLQNKNKTRFEHNNVNV
ncbi:hypothetical protein PCK1_000221 [Pneumocystis canis]|nr:hypothetical protein PCK1_000221 [Pneumocystis canis]